MIQTQRYRSAAEQTTLLVDVKTTADSNCGGHPQEENAERSSSGIFFRDRLELRGCQLDACWWPYTLIEHGSCGTCAMCFACTVIRPGACLLCSCCVALWFRAVRTHGCVVCACCWYCWCLCFFLCFQVLLVVLHRGGGMSAGVAAG